MIEEKRMTKREKAKETAATVFTLIKLQFKAGVKLPRAKTPVRSAVKLLALLSGAGLLLGAFVAVYYVLAGQFIAESGTPADLSREFLIFTLGGFQILQTLFLIPMLIKVLDLNNDRELLLKLPVSGAQIFISKIVVAYMFELVFAAVVLFPILLAYGLASHIGFAFFLLIPVMLLFVPVLPFFLASLVMFPVMRIVRFLRNRPLLTGLLYFAGLVLLIVVYMNIVHGAVFAIADKGFAAALEKNSASIKKAARFIYPPVFFANLFGTPWSTALLNAAGILFSSVALIAATFLIAGARYKKVYMDERVMRSDGGVSRRPYRPLGAGAAVLRKDVINIFRSSNYTFQFLLIVVITPLLVFFCNRTAAYSVYQSFDRVGRVDSAKDMIFGVSLFVTMILIPISACFAASNISREGYNIYHTKLIPVSFRKQLFIKAVIVLAPILVSAAVSCVITTLKYRLTPAHTLSGLTAAEALTLFAVSAFMSIGYVCLGTYLDLRKPLCAQVGQGELVKSTSTVNFVMILGVIIGAGFGILGMFGGFADTFFKVDFSAGSIKIFCLCFSAVFAAVFSCLLFFDGPRKYYRLEQ